jgi:hypothetical protein
VQRAGLDVTLGRPPRPPQHLRIATQRDHAAGEAQAAAARASVTPQPAMLRQFTGLTGSSAGGAVSQEGVASAAATGSASGAAAGSAGWLSIRNQGEGRGAAGYSLTPTAAQMRSRQPVVAASARNLGGSRTPAARGGSGSSSRHVALRPPEELVGRGGELAASLRHRRQEEVGRRLESVEATHHGIRASLRHRRLTGVARANRRMARGPDDDDDEHGACVIS